MVLMASFTWLVERALWCCGLVSDLSQQFHGSLGGVGLDIAFSFSPVHDGADPILEFSSGRMLGPPYGL